MAQNIQISPPYHIGVNPTSSSTISDADSSDVQISAASANETQTAHMSYLNQPLYADNFMTQHDGYQYAGAYMNNFGQYYQQHQPPQHPEYTTMFDSQAPTDFGVAYQQQQYHEMTQPANSPPAANGETPSQPTLSYLPYAIKEEPNAQSQEILDLDAQKPDSQIKMEPNESPNQSPNPHQQQLPSMPTHHYMQPYHPDPSNGIYMPYPIKEEEPMATAPPPRNDILDLDSQKLVGTAIKMEAQNSPGVLQDLNHGSPMMMPVMTHPSPIPQEVKSPYHSSSSPAPTPPAVAPITKSEGAPNKKKSYNCTTCNKWFTSSGHLKRHYNTTLHKNAVKTSGMQDPAVLPPTKSQQPQPQQRDPNKVPDPPQELQPNLNAESAFQNHTNFATGHPNGQAGLSPNSRGLLSIQHSNSMEVCRNSISSSPQPPQLVHMTNNSSSSHLLNDERYSPNNNNMEQSPGLSYQHIYITPPKEENYTSLEDSFQLQPHIFQAAPQQLQPHMVTTNSTSIPGTTTTPTTQQPVHIISAQQLETIFPRTMHTIVDQSGRQYFITPISNHPSPSQVSTTIGSQHNMAPHQYHHHQLPLQHHHQLDPGQQQPPLQGFQTIIGSNGTGFTHLEPVDSQTAMNSYPSPGSETKMILMDDSSRTPSISSATVTSSTPGSVGTPSIKKASKRRRPSSPPSKIFCHECDKEFTKICYLSQHNKAFHSGSLPFRCQKCGKRFATEAIYEKHLAKHSAPDKPFKCDECPKQFHHKTDLRRHTESIHAGYKAHSCMICSKSFSRKDHLRKHIETHDRVKKPKKGPLSELEERDYMVQESILKIEEDIDDYIVDDDEIL